MSIVMRTILEVCCVSLQDCLDAERSGAKRIELCASMAAGGLTPSFGLFQLVKERCKLPVMVMVRPRGAGFCYADEDFEVIKRDAALFLENGADGIVFGILDKDRHIAVEKTKELCNLAHAYEKDAVFHRAIDQCTDIVKEIETLCRLEFDRVLTAGGAGNAEEQSDVLKLLQQRYKHRVQIQMCGNIRDHNVAELVRKTGICNIHTACRIFHQDISDPRASRLFYDNAYDAVNAVQISAMVQILNCIKD